MVTTATAFISVSMTKGTMKSDERRLRAAVSACAPGIHRMLVLKSCYARA